jgi:hypothetical protein
LDQVGGGSTNPQIGHGRRKDQRHDLRAQVEEEDNTNYRMCQRDAGHDEIPGKANHCANPETRATDSNGTIARVGCRSLGT